jgi:23S rRNA maturation mini-RNase III
VAEYNRSTGIEAVVGYLYITGQLDRLNELFAAGDA